MVDLNHGAESRPKGSGYRSDPPQTPPTGVPDTGVPGMDDSHVELLVYIGSESSFCLGYRCSTVGLSKMVVSDLSDCDTFRSGCRTPWYKS